jgi:hypothetical protein
MIFRKNFLSTLAIATILSVLAIPKEAQAADIELIGLSEDNQLLFFNPNNLNRTNKIAISGLNGKLLGIDIRPADGNAYGITDANSIFKINLNDGSATLIANNPVPFTLNGTSFGVDFNPNPDRLRVVSDAEQNLRLNPNTGGIGLNPNGTQAIDIPLAYAAGDLNFNVNPNIVAEAYTNSFAPSPDATRRTTLYAIDADLDVLVTQGSKNFLAGDPNTPVSPNSGQLLTVGSLGVNFGSLGGFDILSSPQDGTNLAFAASGANVYSINLDTGTAQSLGQVAGNVNLVGLTARNVPEPISSVSLLVLGGIFFLKRWNH